MRHEDFGKRRALGADIRALRRSRGLTLTVLAERLGRSTGWLSQVERDLSTPSVDDLRELAQALDAPLSILLTSGAAPEGEAGVIVRAGSRRQIGPRAEGLSEELLSPDLTDDFEVVHSTFAAGAKRSDATRRPTQELGFVQSGQLRLEIDGRSFLVGPGDSFRIRGEAFAWANPGDVPAVVVWVIAPPIY